MTHQGWERLIRTIITGAFLWAALMLPRSLRADQIEMVNGDRYVGQVVSLGPETLVVQSEVLGTLKLPRSRIANINLSSASGARSTTNEVRLPRFSTVLPGSNSLAKASPAAQSNSSRDLSAVMRQLSENSNVVQHVQQQFLAGAGPEAETKFNELLSGLMNGKMNLNDLRAEAKSTLAQARTARKELGEEGGSMLDSYLAILDSFLKETEPDPASTTNRISSSHPLAPKPLPAQ